MTPAETAKMIFDIWAGPDGFIRYHPKDSPRHLEYFGDSPHHSGFFYGALSLLNDHELIPWGWLDAYLNGLSCRDIGDEMVRDIYGGRPPEKWNRDQAMPNLLLSPHNSFFGDFMIWPHHWAFRYRLRKRHEKIGVVSEIVLLLGDLFEAVDLLADIFTVYWRTLKHNPYLLPGLILTGTLPNEAQSYTPDSSLIKSGMRLYVGNTHFPTFLSRFLFSAFKRDDYLMKSFRRYFTFKHENEDRPPPIHLLWERRYQCPT